VPVVTVRADHAAVSGCWPVGRWSPSAAVDMPWPPGPAVLLATTPPTPCPPSRACRLGARCAHRSGLLVLSDGRRRCRVSLPLSVVLRGLDGRLALAR
jgi:hypothetical protein